MWWCSYNSLNRLKHHLVVYLKQVNFMVCKLYLNKALLKKEKRLNIWDRYAGLPISQVWKPQKGEAHRHSARKWRSWVWNLQGCALDHWALLLPKVCLGSALHLSGASNSQVWCQTLASYNNCSLDDEGRGRRQRAWGGSGTLGEPPREKAQAAAGPGSPMATPPCTDTPSPILYPSPGRELGFKTETRMWARDLTWPPP